MQECVGGSAGECDSGSDAFKGAGGDRVAAHAKLQGLLARRPARLVSIAQANKTARIAWAVLTRCETYRAPHMVAA